MTLNIPGPIFSAIEISIEPLLGVVDGSDEKLATQYQPKANKPNAKSVPSKVSVPNGKFSHK